MDDSDPAGVRSSGNAHSIDKDGERVEEEVAALVPVEAYKSLDTGSRSLIKKMTEQCVVQCNTLLSC